MNGSTIGVAIAAVLAILGVAHYSTGMTDSLSAQTPVQSSPSPLPSPPLLPPKPTPTSSIRVSNNQVNLRLINRTGEPISYIVIGDTPERSLAKNQSVFLSKLNLPVTLNAFYSQQQTFEDKSLQVSLKPNNTTGILEITLTPGKDPDGNTAVVRIGRKGQVYLY